MDLETLLSNALIARRKEIFEKYGQLSINELILKLEKFDSNLEVIIDYNNQYPTEPESYRGYYDELAFGFNENEKKCVKDVIKYLKDAIGRTYEGFAGGENTMNKNTPVWVSEYGCVSLKQITDVKLEDNKIIIVTTDCPEE